MIDFLFKLPQENCIAVTHALLSNMNVPVTLTSLKKSLKDHLYYPSMLAVSDVLSVYDVENVAVKVGTDRLNELPLPFVTQIKDRKGKHDFFTVVTSRVGDKLEFFCPEENKMIRVDTSLFVGRWLSGYVLLVGANNPEGEENYHENRSNEKRESIIRVSALCMLPLVVAAAAFQGIFSFGIVALPAVFFMLAAVLGMLITGMLVWYDMDHQHSLLKSICESGGAGSCSKVLKSSASTIGGVKWSQLGMAYFSAELLLLLFNGVNHAPTLSCLAWMSICVIPYVFYSAYYQGRIVKKWCVLCLSVLIVLLLQGTIAFQQDWLSMPVLLNFLESGKWMSLVWALLSMPLLLYFLLPVLKQAEAGERYKRELRRIKLRPEVFNAILFKQKKINVSLDGIGISLGNPAARHKIIKVCNPYCKPCMLAHKHLAELFKLKLDVHLQIIFLTPGLNHRSGLVAAHLLALAASCTDPVSLEQILDDWYLMQDKDYAAYAISHPVAYELNNQGEQLVDMRKWCEKMGVAFTPTIFVNGYQIPDNYHVAELRYLLS
ncbi:Protein-disulfide isomerase [Chitinophaga eiseniae]|uniref:Protein-disulfide isomerase n=1 Tax=Chitinophaga eiseniae TaxID=634771 RepID=A0A1T4PVC6_9BACT|nr:vitamin K epoxide reductase family protein [Chitinophaga eiseniae]SJZ95510.1 Protein-disulfide isomerase [Chitinophaga eiseniae]